MRWAAVLVIAVLGLAVLYWQGQDVSAQAPDVSAQVPDVSAQAQAALADHGTVQMQQAHRLHTHLTTLGVGAVVLALQLFLLHRFRRTSNRVVLSVTASIAILICAALLATGDHALRMRSPRHESLDAVLLRDRPAAVSTELHPLWSPAGRSPAGGADQVEAEPQPPQ